MYKVLIADDEKIIREGLISAIPWEALSMEAPEPCQPVPDRVREATIPSIAGMPCP